MCVEVESTPVPTHPPKGLPDSGGTEGGAGGVAVEEGWGGHRDWGRWSTALSPRKVAWLFLLFVLLGDGVKLPKSVSLSVLILQTLGEPSGQSERYQGKRIKSTPGGGGT